MTNEDTTADPMGGDPDLNDTQIAVALEVLGISRAEFDEALAEGAEQFPGYGTNDLLLDLFSSRMVRDLSARTGIDIEVLWSMHIEGKPRSLTMTATPEGKVTINLELGKRGDEEGEPGTLELPEQIGDFTRVDPPKLTAAD